jgi:hypothetical protein
MVLAKIKNFPHFTIQGLFSAKPSLLSDPAGGCPTVMDHDDVSHVRLFVGPFCSMKIAGFSFDCGLLLLFRRFDWSGGPPDQRRVSVDN